jgi:hypothetical protein
LFVLFVCLPGIQHFPGRHFLKTNISDLSQYQRKDLTLDNQNKRTFNEIVMDPKVSDRKVIIHFYEELESAGSMSCDDAVSHDEWLVGLIAKYRKHLVINLR